MKYEWNWFWSYGMPPDAKGLSCHPGGHWHLLAYPDGAWTIFEGVKTMTREEIEEVQKGLQPGVVFMSPTYETVRASGAASGGVLGVTLLELAQEYCIATYEAIMRVRSKH